MSHDEQLESISGELRQLLFSPKGAIEGLLIKVGAKAVQISMDPSAADAKMLTKALGKTIEIKGSPDHSPKTKDSVHPVYKLKTFTKIAGKAVERSAQEQPIRGVVASIHYAKHGEPNGVMLESGEFIHTRPPGMKKLKLNIGSKVIAHGEIRMTVLGTPLIEAYAVNRVTLE